MVLSQQLRLLMGVLPLTSPPAAPDVVHAARLATLQVARRATAGPTLTAGRRNSLFAGEDAAGGRHGGLGPVMQSLHHMIGSLGGSGGFGSSGGGGSGQQRADEQLLMPLPPHSSGAGAGAPGGMSMHELFTGGPRAGSLGGGAGGGPAHYYGSEEDEEEVSRLLLAPLGRSGGGGGSRTRYHSPGLMMSSAPFDMMPVDGGAYPGFFGGEYGNSGGGYGGAAGSYVGSAGQAAPMGGMSGGGPMSPTRPAGGMMTTPMIDTTWPVESVLVPEHNSHYDFSSGARQQHHHQPWGIDGGGSHGQQQQHAYASMAPSPGTVLQVEVLTGGFEQELACRMQE